MIAPLDQKFVHRICTGQVILDMSIAVKELVENSLDAHASIIEVKLNGLDIEVSDNGDGVAPENYHLLAMQHSTSKLQTIDDLNTISTFGFRGEALASLCAISKSFKISTRTADSEIGKRLEFDRHGVLVKECSIAKTKGTMVTAIGLFDSLMVRKREFMRNIKRENAKCIEILQAYAIQQNVNISCSGSRATGSGGISMIDNISDLFGVKQTQQIVQFDSIFMQSEFASMIVTGYISKPLKGCGRTTNDRQYVYVNNRPCLLPKFTKAINEIYRIYNPTQKPFFALNLRMDCGYDVNLTPDKRTILITDEALFIDKIKSQLEFLFTPFQGIIPSCEKQQQLSLSQIEPVTQAASEEAISDIHEIAIEDLPSSQFSISASSTESSAQIEAAPLNVQLQPAISSISLQRASNLWASAITIDVTASSIRYAIEAKKAMKLANDEKSTVHVFESGIDDASSKVEDEFSRHLSKSDFNAMEIIGQFNTGFIIVRLNKGKVSDLFVVDQHASDEKYTYESLKRNYVVSSQRLLRPVQLDLSARQELVVMENLERLKRSGFEVGISHTGERRGAQLHSLPITAQTTFQIDDLEDLIHKLTDASSDDAVYCTKLLKHFASRACRTSVMIGDKLKKVQMEQIIRNMALMEQPWNCPHGRPTLRHLRTI